MHELAELASWSVLLPWLLGMVFGIFVGSTPGLTATMAVALMVPLSLQLPNEAAGLALVIGVSFSAIFAGDIPATYLRIPGTPASTAATLDAYQLARQGRGREALLTNLCCSSLGGLIGVGALMGLGPWLATFALRFDDYEYFWLMVLGLTFCIVTSPAHQFRAALAALLGLLLSTVGLDTIGNAPRFTFPEISFLRDLLDGVHFIPAMIGLFGLAEALRWRTLARRPFAGESRSTAGGTEQMTQRTAEAKQPDRLTWMRALRHVWQSRVVMLVSAGMGTLVGALPGAGADIAAWAAYGVAGKLHRGEPELGQGAWTGVVAPTSANNAAVAGAWIPALAFGLPGDSVTAIVVGAFSVYNIRPGPEAFTSASSGVPALLQIALVTQLLLLPAGWLGIRFFSWTLKLPAAVLRSSVILFCVVGAYAVSNSWFDVWVMLAFGGLGVFLDWQRVPLAPLILGMILGGQLETYLRSGLIASQGSWQPFVTRPDAMLLWIAVIVVLGFSVARSLVAGARPPAAQKGKSS